jgi:transcription antitermination factor NusG
LAKIGQIGKIQESSSYCSILALQISSHQPTTGFILFYYIPLLSRPLSDDPKMTSIFSSDSDSDGENEEIVQKQQPEAVSNPRAAENKSSNVLLDDSDDDSGSDIEANKSRKRRRNESPTKKKLAPAQKKRLKRSSFIKETFNSSDEDEESDFESNEVEHETLEEKRMREAAESKIDQRRKAERDVLQGDNAESVADIAARFAARNKAQRQRARYYRKKGKQQRLQHSRLHLPTIKDPCLFAVKCKPGKEKDLVAQITLKAFHFMKDQNKEPLKILSTSSTRTRGYIYIEARIKQHVIDAIRGMNFIYPSKVSKVPVREMTTTLTINARTEVVVKEGQWVRLKRNPFKGDLAKVIQVSSSEKKAIVQVVPRIDLTTKAALLESETEGINPKTGELLVTKKWINPTNKINPTQQFFDREVVLNHVQECERTEAGRQLKLNAPESRQYEHMQGQPNLIYYCRGFYTSTGWRVIHYPLSALKTNVQPRLEEAEQFTRNFGLGDVDDEYNDDDEEMGFGRRSDRKGANNGGAIAAIAATMGGTGSSSGKSGGNGSNLVEGDVVSSIFYYFTCVLLFLFFHF